VATVENELQAW